MSSALAAVTPVWIDHRPEHTGPANVLVNLPSVGDEEWAADITERLDFLMKRITTLAATTHEVVAGGELRAPIASNATSGPATSGTVA